MKLRSWIYTVESSVFAQVANMPIARISINLLTDLASKEFSIDCKKSDS